MSEVISFRLDKNNPREAQAIEKLNRWVDRVYSSRFILIQALLGIDDIDVETEKFPNHEINSVSDQLNSLLGLLNNKQTKNVPNYLVNENPIPLNDSFLCAIKQGIKPGIEGRR